MGSFGSIRRRVGDSLSIVRDLRSGAARWPIRLALTLVAAAASVAIVLFGLGVIESSGGRLDDEQVAVAVIVGGVTWCVATGWIWLGHRRARRIIIPVIGIVGLWAVMIPICVALDATVRRSELLIASCVFVGVALTTLIVAIAAYVTATGRPIEDPDGRVDVHCPSCGYSMVGLESCHCPECGAQYTLDRLICAQEYGAVRRSAAWSSTPPAVNPLTDGADVAMRSLPASPLSEPIRSEES